MATADEKLIILGSGPAGLSAAIYGARAHLHPLVMDGPMPGGQLMSTSAVENWPGETSILGPDLMQKLRTHALSLGVRFLSEQINSVDIGSSPFTLITHRQKTLHTRALIIATGASPKKLGCPGEGEYWGKGVTTCAVCDGAFYRDKRVVIVGGGDTAMENASFMTNFTNKITIVHILPELTASYAMQQRVLSHPEIKVIYNSTVSAIEGDGKNVKQVVITNKQTGNSSSLETDGVFVSIGIKPNTDLFKNQLEMNHHGYIILKKHTMTSVPGVFAAGDVADYRYRQAITSAGSGCEATLDAERYLKEQSL
jgi:thioredoxin reductase (NADPH)